MNRHQFSAVGERALHLHLVHHLRHPRQHIFNTEQLLALVHQGGNPLAIADKFEQLRRDQRGRLRVVQPQAPGIALLRHKPGVVQY